MCEYCNAKIYVAKRKIMKDLMQPLTPEGVLRQQLEDMRINKLLIENDNRINKLLSLVPKDLKAGEFIITRCPNCNAKLKIARAKLNGHLWIVCEKEGVLICQ